MTQDITTIDDPKSLLDPSVTIDGIIGGPPCQGFSLSGNRDPKDPRNSLFREFVRFIEAYQPKFFMMENVLGILSAQTASKESVVDLIMSEYNRVGYNAKYEVLNAAEFGVPQARQRVIFIGIRKDIEFNADRTHPKGKFFDNQVCIRDAIMDLPKILSGGGSEEQEYTEAPKTEYQSWVRNGSQKVYNHIAMRHTKRLVERFATIQQGQSLADVAPEHMQRQRGDATKISGKAYSQNNMRPYGDRPSPTIAASFQSNFVHPYYDRNYTAREAARLQSFPDTYIFKGKRTTMSWEKNLSQYQQIGNAVPPLLAKAIAENIIKYFNED